MDVDDWPLTGDCGDTECLIPKRAAELRGDLMRQLNELHVFDRPLFAPLPFWGGTP